VPLDGGARRPDVEEQAVLGIVGRAILRADGAKRSSGTELLPAWVRLRWSPAQVSDGWQRIGNAAITVESTAGLAGASIARPQTLPAGASTVPTQSCAVAGVTDSPPPTSQIAIANPSQPSGEAARFTTPPFVIEEASAPKRTGIAGLSIVAGST